MSTNYIAPIWRMPENTNNTPDDKLSNYSISFNPVDPNYIQIADNIFSGLENFSISVWYNTNTVTGDRAIFGSWNTAPAQMVLYWDDPDGWRFLMSDGTSASVDGPNSIDLNQWNHIVVTYDGSTLKFYHNNDTPISNPTVRGPIQASTNSWNIGADNNGARLWNGEISQFCLFDYTLSTSQVDYLYNLNNPMVPSTVNLTTPVAYWPLGDNSNPNAPGSFPNISAGTDSVFNFDGTQAIDTPLVNLGVDASVSMWFNPDAAVVDYALLGYSAAGFDYVIRRSSGTLFVWIGSTFYGFTGFGSNVVDDDWNFLALTKELGEVNLYLKNSNGEFSVSRAEASWETADLIFDRVGARSITPINLGFQGEISNVQAWDVALLPTEIDTLYNNGQPLMTGTQPQEANIKAWYKLNQSANYDEGQLVNWTISRIGNPNYGGSNDGCYSVNPGLRWHDNNFITVSSDYFQWNSPTYKTRGTNVVLSSSGGEWVSTIDGNEIILEYSIDGGAWTLWHQETNPGYTGSTPVTFTIPSTSNLTVVDNIRVRVKGVDYGSTSPAFTYIQLYNIQLSGGTFSYNEDFNESQRYGWFANNGGLQPPVEYDPEPGWQIPDAVSAYPQSFEFTKTPQEYIDLGKDDWFNEYNNEITFSVWINKKDWSNSGFEGIISKYGGNAASLQYRIAYPSSAGIIQFYLQGSATDGSGYSARIKSVTLTSAQQASEWLHIIWRHDASTNRSEAIFNGDYANAISLSSSTNAGQDIAGHPYAQPVTTITNMIGNISNGLQPFDGAISNYQRFNSYLDNTAVEALYNEGVPSTTAIAPTNLKAWYKLDNNELFDGTNWSVENQRYPANWESSLNSNALTGMLRDDDSKSEYDNQIFSMSAWVKPKSGVATNGFIFSCRGSSWQGVSLSYSGNALIFQIGDKNTTAVDGGSPANNGNWSFYENRVPGASPTYTPYDQWSHIVVVWNGTNSKFYINGNLVSTITPPSALTIDYSQTSTISAIGGRNDAGSGYFTGDISNFAYWESELDQTAVTALYNNGTPEVTISQSPNHWFTLKDFATGSVDKIGSLNYENTLGTIEFVDNFVSTEAVQSSGLTRQSLVNNNVSVLNGESLDMTSTNLVTSNLTRTQPYSNYSMNFDTASADYLEVADPGEAILAYGENQFTFSGWIWPKTFVDQAGLITRHIDSLRRSTIKLSYQNGFDGIMFQSIDSPTTPNFHILWDNILSSQVWQHVCFVYNGVSASCKLYIDGKDQGAGVITGSIPSTLPNFNGNPLYIGVDAMNGLTNRNFNGKFSNFCVFDRVLSESEILKIYNNGITQNLKSTSSFSNNIAAWWPMDEHSSYYEKNNWNNRDLQNGNEAKGINTGNVNDLVGNAPGSDASGVGENLAIADLTGNMYNSKNNAYSINMGDYADGVINPADSGRSTNIPSV